MIELQGKYNTAKVFTDNVEPEAISQIINLLNQEFVKDSKIRIMPDTHAGAGCTIGTTMTITDKIVPNLVGVDIGCGMTTVALLNRGIEVEVLDEVIHKNIPAGFSVRSQPHKLMEKINLKELRCATMVDLDRAELSLGTLGGGNHFIEINKDDNDALYLVVHSGSRNLGKQVAEYYQKAAASDLNRRNNDMSEIIKKLKSQGRQEEIETELKKYKAVKIDKNLAYVEGSLLDDYIHDMNLVQRYASLNRLAIANDIIERMTFSIKYKFDTIHNYINTDDMILRKGAVSAKTGERILIPINMRDGSLVCVGKGNPDWNYSAPHGAGRLMSRSKAKESISLEDFQKSMQGIFSTTVKQSTIDESPFAYKSMEDIISNISDTAEVIDIIRPIYNFKSAD